MLDWLAVQCSVLACRPHFLSVQASSLQAPPHKLDLLAAVGGKITQWYTRTPARNPCNDKCNRACNCCCSPHVLEVVCTLSKGINQALSKTNWLWLWESPLDPQVTVKYCSDSGRSKLPSKTAGISHYQKSKYLYTRRKLSVSSVERSLLVVAN